VGAKIIVISWLHTNKVKEKKCRKNLTERGAITADVGLYQTI
jgi:hypothetical protein